MQRKGDAGAASLKKVPTDLLKERVATELAALDEKVHLAKLEVNNQRGVAGWPAVIAALEVATHLAATHNELVARATRGR